MSDSIQPGPASNPALARAVTPEELRATLSRLITAEGMQRGLAFRPRPTDVIVSPYAKCGTTWMQQIAHGLRSRGSMDFREITEVVPWIEIAHDMGLDLEGPQVGEPRVFKSHCPWDAVPKGARYIYTIRDPRDAVVSLYRFFEGWLFEPGSISIETFASEFFLHGTMSGRYWDHLAGWWAQREREDVLILSFEDMKRDLAGTVRRVARFMGVDADQALLDLVIEQSSYEFMRAHERQFDDHLLREARDQACGLPPGGVTTKVRAGRVGDHVRELPASVIETMDAMWREVIEARFGFRSYADMRAALAAGS